MSRCSWNLKQIYDHWPGKHQGPVRQSEIKYFVPVYFPIFNRCHELQKSARIFYNITVRKPLLKFASWSIFERDTCQIPTYHLALKSPLRNEGRNDDCHTWQFVIFHFCQLSHHFLLASLYLYLYKIFYLWLPKRPQNTTEPFKVTMSTHTCQHSSAPLVPHMEYCRGFPSDRMIVKTTVLSKHQHLWAWMDDSNKGWLHLLVHQEIGKIQI